MRRGSKLNKIRALNFKNSLNSCEITTILNSSKTAANNLKKIKHYDFWKGTGR